MENENKDKETKESKDIQDEKETKESKDTQEQEVEKSKDTQEQGQQTTTTVIETVEWNGRIHRKSQYSEEHWRFILELVEKDRNKVNELTAKRAELTDKIEKLKKELEIAENEKKKIEAEMMEIGILQKEAEIPKNGNSNGKRKEQIVEILKATPGLTQKQIAEKLGVTAQAIYASLQALRADGLITKNENTYSIK